MVELTNEAIWFQAFLCGTLKSSIFQLLFLSHRLIYEKLERGTEWPKIFGCLKKISDF